MLFLKSEKFPRKLIYFDKLCSGRCLEQPFPSKWKGFFQLTNQETFHCHKEPWASIALCFIRNQSHVYSFCRMITILTFSLYKTRISRQISLIYEQRRASRWQAKLQAQAAKGPEIPLLRLDIIFNINIGLWYSNCYS